MRKLNRKRMSLLMVIIILCLYVSGCGLRKKEAREGITTITYGTWECLSDQRQIHKDMLKAFYKEHPDIHVKVEYNTREKLLDRMGGNAAPDVFYWLPYDLPKIASKGQTLNLAPFVIIEDKSFDWDDFYPAGLEFSKYQNSFHALPIQIAVYPLFYNKDIFDKEGLSYPDDNWTWEDYLEAARRLTKDLDNDGRIDQYGTLLPVWGFITGSYGINFFNYDMTDIQFDTPEFRQALQYLTDLRLKYKVAPTSEKVEKFGGDAPIFMSGRVAMCCGHSWMFSKFAKIKNFRWDIAPQPFFTKNQKGTSGVTGGINCISSRTRYPQAAWKFVKFYSSKQGLIIQAKFRNCIPARRSSAMSSVFRTSPPEHIQYFLDMAERGVFKFPVGPDKMARYSEWSATIMNRELQLLYLDKQTVEETVENLLQRTKHFL